MQALIWVTNFFWRFQLYLTLDTVPSCNIVQYQGNPTMQTWENGKKPNFGSNFGSLSFISVLATVPSYHPVQSKGKLKNKTWENSGKSTIGPNFDLFGLNFGSLIFFLWILPLLDVKHCRKLSLYAAWRKTCNQKSRKWQKTSF